MTGKQKILAVLRQSLVVAIVALAAIYVGDYLWVRYRAAHQTPGHPFDAVPVQLLLAVPLKGGKIEYDVNQGASGATQTCVHSLFSHYGYAPCWYVVRQNRNPVPLVLLP